MGVSLSSRLARYSAVAAGVAPLAAASGAVIGDASLGLVLGSGGVGFNNPQGVDFGPGFGEIFFFDAYLSTRQGPTFFSNFSENYVLINQVVRYDFLNSAGFDASIRKNASPFDPVRLASGALVNSGAFVNMTNFGPTYGTAHDLATGYSALLYPLGGLGGAPVGAYSGSSGDWASFAQSVRGFVGFRITNNGGATYNYGWFDVEVSALQLTMTVHGWGLQTTPNAPILAGEIPAPAAGGLLALALGASGIRRARRAVA